MNEFAVIGALAAFLGTCMQLFDAVTRGSLRMALEDSNALDDLVKSQLRTYPVWHLRQRRQARGRLRSELLTPADQRRLVHANRQLLGWALIWVSTGYGVVVSLAAAFSSR